MNKAWLIVVVLLAVLPAMLDAQGRGGGRGGRGGGARGGSGGSNRGAAPKDNGTETDSKPTVEKPADLSALSITAKWKDAKTLEITATVKNVGPGEFKGSRTAYLTIKGKDGKPESVKSETIPELAVGETHVFKFEATDKKYFEKELRWTLEVTPSDATTANDKKTTTVSPGPQPKS